MYETIRISDISIADDPKFITRIIDDHKISNIPRLEKLDRYYNGEHDILNRPMIDPAKPNNKIVHPFPSYITNTVNGYFMGKPVTYSSDNPSYVQAIQGVLGTNDESYINAQHSKNASVKGLSAELIYMNEANEIKFNLIDVRELVLIYSDSIDPELIGAIRYYELKDYMSDKTMLNVELYTADEIITYSEGKSGLAETDRIPHYFKEVPVIAYYNNAELSGDWERLIPLIDAYDMAVSDHSNMLEYFSDCYLVLSGLTAEPEDIAAMKENRVMLLGENGKAEFLTKTADVQTLETYKVRLERDIHKFAQVPDIQAEGFTSDLSGIAINYKLQALEQLSVTKERLFKRALQKRIRLITNMLNLQGASFEYTDVTLQFERNLPVNVAEKIASVKNLYGIVSMSTLLQQLPFIEDVQAELDRIAADGSISDDYNDIGG